MKYINSINVNKLIKNDIQKQKNYFVKYIFVIIIIILEDIILLEIDIIYMMSIKMIFQIIVPQKLDVQGQKSNA